jgi:beta-lactamase class A
MITVSSNFATNLLIEKLDVEKVKATVRRLGADGMKVLRGVEDSKAFEKGLNNETTARGLLILFEKLGRGEAVSATADREMIEVLKRQEFRDAIPAGLPAGTTVAHKTGSITRIQHDAGIVYGPRPYVLVVLVRGIDDGNVAKKVIAAISRAVWESTGSTR